MPKHVRIPKNALVPLLKGNVLGFFLFYAFPTDCCPPARARGKQIGQ